MIGKPSKPILVELEYDKKGECTAFQIIHPSDAFDNSLVNCRDLAHDLYIKHNNGSWSDELDGKVRKQDFVPKWKFI